MTSPPSLRARHSVASALLASIFPLLASGALAQQPSARAPMVLDTVRVHGRTEVGSAHPARTVEVIGRNEIARSPARSVADLLALRLGVDLLARSPAQADLSLRGSSAEQVLVLVDGVRVTDRQTGHFALDLAVPLAAVERVEVLRGASAALYGSDAVGGVINIVTRAASGEASVQARGGSFGTAAAAASFGESAGRLALQVTGDWERSSGHRPGTDFDVRQGRARLEHPLGSGSLALDAGVAVRAFGAADFYGPYPSFERTGTTTTALRWTSDASSPWGISAVVHSRIHSDRYVLDRDDPSRYENRHRTRQTGMELTARRTWGQGLGVALGVEGADDRLTSERLGERDEQRGAAFGELAVSHRSGTTVHSGLRVDRVTGHSAFVSPSLAIGVPVRDDVTLRGSVARGLRSPTWTERFYEDPANVGDPDLRPESFWTGEVGARLTIARRASLDVAAWAREARDLVDWSRPVDAPETVPWRTRNVRSGTFRGLDATVRLHDVLGGDWRARGGLTSLTARDAQGFVSKYALRPLDRLVSVGGTFTLPWAIVADVEVTHARRTDDEDGPHTRADLRLERGWRDFAFTVDVRNLGDAGYRDVVGRPVAGRAIHVGLRWTRQARLTQRDTAG